MYLSPGTSKILLTLPLPTAYIQNNNPSRLAGIILFR